MTGSEYIPTLLDAYCEFGDGIISKDCELCHVISALLLSMKNALLNPSTCQFHIVIEVKVNQL